MSYVAYVQQSEGLHKTAQRHIWKDYKELFERWKETIERVCGCEGEAHDEVYAIPRICLGGKLSIVQIRYDELEKLPLGNGGASPATLRYCFCG